MVIWKLYSLTNQILPQFNDNNEWVTHHYYLTEFIPLISDNEGHMKKHINC